MTIKLEHISCRIRFHRSEYISGFILKYQKKNDYVVKENYKSLSGTLFLRESKIIEFCTQWMHLATYT